MHLPTGRDHHGVNGCFHGGETGGRVGWCKIKMLYGTQWIGWIGEGVEMSLILPDSNQTNVQGPKWLNHGQWGATGKSKFSTINSPTVKAKVSDLRPADRNT